MKPHKPKTRDKTRAKKKRETKAIKTKLKKRRKDNRPLSPKKVKRGGKINFDKKAIKEDTKIKVLAHELLAFTLSYLMLAPW
jgi:hypothetical protein